MARPWILASIGRRWVEGKNEDMLVDVLRSGKSIFSRTYVSLFNLSMLFSLHILFGDTEYSTEKMKFKHRIAIFFSCEQLSIIFN